MNYTINLDLDDRIILTKHAKTQKGLRLSAKKKAPMDEPMENINVDQSSRFVPKKM